MEFFLALFALPLIGYLVGKRHGRRFEKEADREASMLILRERDKAEHERDVALIKLQHAEERALGFQILCRNAQLRCEEIIGMRRAYFLSIAKERMQ